MENGLELLVEYTFMVKLRCFGVLVDNRWNMRFNLMLCAKAYPKESFYGMIKKLFYVSDWNWVNRIGIAWLKAVTVVYEMNLGNSLNLVWLREYVLWIGVIIIFYGEIFLCYNGLVFIHYKYKFCALSGNWNVFKK